MHLLSTSSSHNTGVWCAGYTPQVPSLLGLLLKAARGVTTGFPLPLLSIAHLLNFSLARRHFITAFLYEANVVSQLCPMMKVEKYNSCNYLTEFQC